ncbi:MAG: hypothetical protein M1420_00075 [Actinobacteria bacterium]|nr:hypothetical protein [Actinomycetota bacterium]
MEFDYPRSSDGAKPAHHKASALQTGCNRAPVDVKLSGKLIDGGPF